MLPLVVIIGPTAVGKTSIAVDLALLLNGEIISGDSMQVYRKMDIGTAKISPAEMKGIPHHLLDIKDPDEPFSVAEFQKIATEKIEEIVQRKKIPLLVGGTGLYIQAVIDDYQFAQQENVSAYRKMLLSLAEKRGSHYLHTLLEDIDPVSARKIHANDLKRTTRALEYFYITGKRISENYRNNARVDVARYNVVLIGLTMDRHTLYERINLRVDQMMEEGFLNEVQALVEQGFSPDLPAMQGLGYRQLLCYLRGEYDLTTAVDLIKRDTRRFAKRQLTWFRKDPRINWFHVDKYPNYQELLREIMTIVGRTIGFSVE